MRRLTAAMTRRSAATAATHSGNLAQQMRRRAQHPRQRAEAFEQRLGDRLGVAARNQAKQQQLEQLVVGERVGAGLVEAFTQAVAMAVHVLSRDFAGRFQFAVVEASVAAFDRCVGSFRGSCRLVSCPISTARGRTGRPATA